jgi:hypothetical protein
MNPYFLLISFLAVNLVVGGCTHSTPNAAGPGAVPVAVIAGGPVGDGTDVQPGGLWIADQEQLDMLIQRMLKGTRLPHPLEALPDIDFASEGVLFIWMGRQPTGGYALELVAQQAEIKDQTVMVPVRRITPRKGALVTQMITHPYLMLRLGKGDYATITIVDPDTSDEMVVPTKAK